MPFIYALDEKALCLDIYAGLMAQLLKNRIQKYPLKKEIKTIPVLSSYTSVILLASNTRMCLERPKKQAIQSLH